LVAGGGDAAKPLRQGIYTLGTQILYCTVSYDSVTKSDAILTVSDAVVRKNRVLCK
jgi:hypothetical protein